MANYNKVMLMGNLTRDPQLSYTPNQTAVVHFGLAVNRKWKGQDGSQREETCFVDCTAFGRQAETINKYLSKGRPVFVEGRLTFDSWTGQDGTKRSRLKVTVENFQFLPRGGDGGGPPSADSDRGQQSPDGEESSAGGGPPQGGKDDIPF
ncbi:MAG: single-stranded DNA-binding protein [Phycisphaerae bacterium]|nr:single-stranded DNA-binding protein [Phycisphaerae bacterium]